MNEFFKKAREMVKKTARDVSGQAITEYVAMVAMFLGLTFILVTLLRVFSDYGWRILGLVGMDYP